MLQCQAVLRAGRKAGDKVMILQDLITEQFTWSRRWWKFYFSDLEIISQMTQYFCDRNYNITCSHEHSCKGEGFFCFMTFLNHVYLRGEKKITWHSLGCEPEVLLQCWQNITIVQLRYLEKSPSQSCEHFTFTVSPQSHCVHDHDTSPVSMQMEQVKTQVHNTWAV